MGEPVGAYIAGIVGAAADEHLFPDLDSESNHIGERSIVECPRKPGRSKEVLELVPVVPIRHIGKEATWQTLHTTIERILPLESKRQREAEGKGDLAVLERRDQRGKQRSADIPCRFVHCAQIDHIHTIEIIEISPGKRKRVAHPGACLVSLAEHRRKQQIERAGLQRACKQRGKDQRVDTRGALRGSIGREQQSEQSYKGGDSVHGVMYATSRRSRLPRLARTVRSFERSHRTTCATGAARTRPSVLQASRCRR